MVNIQGLHLTKLLVITLLLFPFNTYSQKEQFGIIKSKFNERRNNTLQEKMYVHTDKSVYLAGDIIWFKIYTVEANTNEHLDLSKVAYIELLDYQNNLLLRASIFLIKGVGQGSFAVPFTFPSGAYQLRAYTNWMKNDGSDILFDKKITIINTFKMNALNVGYKSPSYYIDIFPEGGNLVYNVQSRVAFKIADSGGIGSIAKVFLLSNQDTIGRFSTLLFGMGSFNFTPVKGKSYAVSVSLPDGKILSKPLPLIYDKGYVMKVDKDNEQELKISIQSGFQNNDDVFLAINNNEKMIGSEYLKLNNGKTNFTIPIKSLGEGINYFTLFTNTTKPVCERLYFLPPRKITSIKINTEAKIYETRTKVNINFKVSDSAEFSHSGLSLSVYRIDSLQPLDELNIANYLLLLSGLKGTVESPDYYLTGSGTAYEHNVDNLMLTHGWRRFRWENILDDSIASTTFPLEYKGQIINGILVNKQNSQPVKDALVFLSIPGRRFQFHSTKTQDSGKFWFDVGKYFGDGHIVVQTKADRDSVNKVVLKSPGFADDRKEPKINSGFSIPQNYFSTLERYHIAMQAQNIYARKQGQQFAMPSAIDTLPFFGTLGKTYLLDDYTRFNTMEDVFREYVTEVNVAQHNGRPRISVLDESRKTFFRENILILIDGVPLFNADEIFTYDPLKVQRIQVIPKRYILGPSSFNGIVSLTTYQGNYDGLALHSNAMEIPYNGMQYEREFYSPVYESEYQFNTRIPDFRNTLFWSSKIDYKDPKGLFFYTSDFPGKYVANLQGISLSGKPFSALAYFEVKAK